MRRLLKAALLLGAVLIPAVAIAANMRAFKLGGLRVDATGATATTPVTGSPPTPGSHGIPASTLAVLEIGAFPTTVSVKVASGSACNVELTRGEGMAH